MIICLGVTPTVQRTMMFDRLVVDQVNRATLVDQYASGKAINVTRVLHALGCKSLALGFVGGDTGKFIRDELDREGLSHDLQGVAPVTRLCITLVDRSAGTTTELVQEASPVPVEAYDALLNQFTSRISAAQGVVISGALTMDGPVDFYARCAAIAVRAGIPVVMDTRGEPLRRALAFHPTVIKPNRAELEETVGEKIDSDASLKNAIQRLIEWGPRWVVVTHGTQETIISDGKVFRQFSTPLVKTVNPIGSGDSFAAGLAAALAQGQTVPQACRLAIACGAANATTSRAGHVRQEDVEALLPAIVDRPF